MSASNPDPKSEAHPQPTGNGKPPGTTSWDRSVTELGTRMRSYYGRPVLKEPVWKPHVAVYFFTGGLAGASSALGYIARRRGNDRLANASSWIALLADTVSPALLVYDLGRPERFYNMLRVFKVTSPMSVGSWILTFSGTSSGLAVAADLLGLKGVRNKAEAASAAFGLPLSVYTATLVSNTAVPVWHEARRELPFVFAATSASTAGAAASLVLDPADAGPARRVAVGGAIADLALTLWMEGRLGFLGEPYKQDAAGRYARVGKALTAAGSAVLGLAGRRSRAAAVAGGALMLAGELGLRLSIYKAGFQSARNPLYTVDPQRERADREGGRASSRTGRRHVPRAHGAGEPPTG